jgi:hypothetical protein
MKTSHENHWQPGLFLLFCFPSCSSFALGLLVIANTKYHDVHKNPPRCSLYMARGAQQRVILLGLTCERCILTNEFLGLKGCEVEQYTSCSENMHLALTGFDSNTKLRPAKLAEIASLKFCLMMCPNLG